jgi:thiosulfate/3-mercaptopyruvate sulfurtransferase
MDKNTGYTGVNSNSPSSPVVTATWLYEQLDRPEVIVIDCRFSLADAALGRQQYQTNHIPRAFFLDLNQDLSSPVQQHGGRHPLPEPMEFAQKLAAMGISSGTAQPPTHVVVYDDSHCAFAARCWWLLRYLGHDRISVLDGGWKAWLAAGYPVTSEIPSPQPAQFVPAVRSNWVVEIEAVKRQKELPGIALVDSREAERYRGEREPIDPIAGHIPGALNFPWQEVTDAQGYLLPAAEQQQRWSDLSQAEEILVYCGSGVTACVNLLSLELAGIETGKLYAGSWSDWCSYLV